MTKLSTFCILPFTHLATHPQGEVTACCESKLKFTNNGEVVKLGETPINEIRNSDTAKQIRQSMLEGKKHIACDFCYSRELGGLESKRHRENRKYNVKEEFLEKYKSLPLESIELRLGNVCNAKCIICNPNSSSKWNEDADKYLESNFDGGYAPKVLPNTWFKDDSFYEDVFNNIDSVQHLWFNGGEPLLIKQHLSFLNKVVSTGYSKNIELEYHTNGTLVTNKLIELWKNFKFVKITLSIDDVEDRFEYSRYPLKFNTVKNSIELLKENNIHYDIIPTISLLNVFNITEIYRYYKDRYGKEVIYNYLKYPKFQSIINLPEESKQGILKSVQLPEKLYKELEFELYSSKGNSIKQALSFYSYLDKKRNLDIQETLPEFKLLKSLI